MENENFAEKLMEKLSILDHLDTEPLNFIFEGVLSLSMINKKSEDIAIDFKTFHYLTIAAISASFIDLYESSLKYYLYFKSKNLKDKDLDSFLNPDFYANALIKKIIPVLNTLISDYSSGKLSNEYFEKTELLKSLQPKNADIFDQHNSFFKKHAEHVKKMKELLEKN